MWNAQCGMRSSQPAARRLGPAIGARRPARPGLHSSIRVPRFAGRGVTFIEIMIVLLILGVFSVLAVPTMKGFHRQGQLAAAAREFALVARYARQQAVLLNRTTEVVIDFDKDSYRFVPNPAEKKTFRTSRERTTEMERLRTLSGKKKKLRVFFKSVECPEDGDGKRSTVRIRFYKNGSASPSTVVIADAEQRMMTIQIAGATGAVRVYAGAPRKEEAAAPPIAGLN